MTRKDFQAFADYFALSKPDWDASLGGEVYAGRLVQWRTDVRNVAKVCAQADPRFDEVKFLAACTYAGESLFADYCGGTTTTYVIETEGGTAVDEPFDTLEEALAEIDYLSIAHGRFLRITAYPQSAPILSDAEIDSLGTF